MKKIVAMLMAALLLTGTAAVAGTTKGATKRTQPTTKKRFEARQQKQERRINKGVQTGALTQKEATRLQRQEQRLDTRADKMAASGGKMTVGERRALERQQDAMSRRIYKQKHDKQTQPPAQH